MQGTWENGRFVLASTKDAQIAALREERDRLAEELVEARKPDCRTCARLIQEADGPICSRAWVTRDICVDGNHYEYQPPLVRLYENAALAAKGTSNVLANRPPVYRPHPSPPAGCADTCST